MLHKNDIIKELIDSTHYRTKYRATCDLCGKDRGYLTKQNAQKPHCVKCCVRSTTASRQKMSTAKLGKIPWNKGKVETRDVVIEKLSKAKKNKIPPNKGFKMSYEQKVKLSCAVRGISLKDFDEFKTPEAKLERNKFADLKLHVQCFERDNYTCQVCDIKQVTLNAHHKNSWKHFKDQRFELTNLISLCTYCHKAFHVKYGNGKIKPNTVQQYEEFKSQYTIKPKKTIYIVGGVPGSGKSWICSQLIDKFYYVKYDKTDKHDTRALMWNCGSTQILYDPTTHISSFIKRNADLFDLKLLIIIEDEATIKTRLANRNGNFTESIKRRMKRMLSLSIRATFSCSSREVLDYLLTIK